MSSQLETDSTVVHLGDTPITIRGYRGEYLFEQIRRATDFYERDLLDLIQSLNLPSGAIVDVGANIGNHTLFLATAFPERKIIAVEPYGPNLELLRSNLIGNDLFERVAIQPFVLSTGDGLVAMREAIAGNLGSVKVEEGTDGVGEYPTRRLDDLVGDEPVALLKIDVEGHEVAVIRGGAHTIERFRPVIVAEAHDAHQVREIEAIIGPLGYIAGAIRGKSQNYVWIPEDSDVFGATRPAGRLSVETLSTVRREIAHGFDNVYKRLAAREDADVPLNNVTAVAVDSVGRDIEAAVAKHVFSSRIEAGSIRQGIEDVHAALARLADQCEARERDREVVRGLAASIETRRSEERDQLAMALESLASGIAALEQRQLSMDAQQGARYQREAEAWRAAYERLSRLMAAVAPEVWVDDAATLQMTDDAATLEMEPSVGAAATSGVREVTPVVDRDSVRIGIATMPGREAGLAKVLESLHRQADEIFVYLNGYDKPPTLIPTYENVRYFTGEDLGDRGKFAFLEGFQGYYLTCDDDIEYPRFYVAHVVAGIERYGRRAAVGWHGSVFKEPFTNYYSAESRRVFAYYSGRPVDTPVHLLGTGATGFHTSTLDFSMEDMPVANMADVWFAVRAREQHVPLVVLAHERGWAAPIDRTAPSISNSSLGRHSAAQLDMRALVTAEVSSRSPWPTPKEIVAATKPELRLGIVGRVDRDRWKKGGILKSSHLTADALRRFGADVRLEDIETGDPFEFGGWSPNVVMVYVGDPERPDFARVADCIAGHAGQGRTVVVNMSLEGSAERTSAIAQWMTDWERDFPGRVHLMVFSNAARALREFAPFRERVVVLPKTIEQLAPPRSNFHTSSGVFVGDVAKLSDASLIEGDVKEWLSAIREELPGVPLIGVRQYKPRYDVDLGLDVVWPFMRGDMAERVSSTRLMVSLVSRATFEMVPVEVASAGVPVIHRAMPQSLSEYLSMSSVEVATPSELRSVVSEMYNNAAVWRSFSVASRRRAQSLDLDSTAGQMYVQLVRLARSEAP